MVPLILISLLADANPSAKDVGDWVMVACVFVGLLAALVTVAAYFATRREVDDLKERISDLEKASEQRSVKTHERIDEILKALATSHR